MVFIVTDYRCHVYPATPPLFHPRTTTVLTTYYPALITYQCPLSFHFVHLPHVLILLDFHRFTKKKLVQSHTLQSLQIQLHLEKNQWYLLRDLYMYSVYVELTHFEQQLKHANMVNVLKNTSRMLRFSFSIATANL